MTPEIDLSTPSIPADLGSDVEVENVRRPPQSIESEQSVLGALLIDNNAFDNVSDVLKTDDFYRREHRIIYETIAQMCAVGKPADVVTVYGELQASGRAQDIGGLQYLNALAESTPSAANVRRYAEIVRDRSILRQLITAGETISTSAFSPESANVSTLLDRAQTLVMQIDEQNSRGRTGFRSLRDLATEVTVELETLQKTGSADDVTGLPTSFTKLDRMTTGLHKGDLVIVAGRPAMGKTTFAINIAEHAALVHKIPVAVFSMEMTSVQLTKRIISSVARIDAQKMRRGRLDSDEWQRYSETVALLAKAPFYIDDSGFLSINEVRARARRLVRRTGPLGLIVVDYLQLMAPNARSREENRAAEVAEFSRGLKSLAKELEVPIIALSQLNRGVDARAEHRPVMSDLRESGSIEQDADTIMFIYRDWVYNKSSNPNLAEVIIGKQRSGPTGTVELRFDGQFTRFDNLAEDVDVPAGMDAGY